MSSLKPSLNHDRHDRAQYTVRLLRVNYDDGSVPLVVVDEGQDFESLYAEWCALDDAFCDGRLSERQWRDIQSFLEERGVSLLQPSAVQDLCDYYGLLDPTGD